MGSCTEFGCRIQEGCDEHMVPGTASCSCPTCHVVCTGQFSGCATVWSRGAQAVDFEPRRSEPRRLEAAPSPGAAADVEPGAHRTTNVSSIEVEMTSLLDRIETVNAAWSLGGPSQEQMAAVTLLLSDLRYLPDAISAAMTEALTDQHKRIMDDIRRVIADGLADAERAGRREGRTLYRNSTLDARSSSQ
jgi:hypothetical protein